MTIRSLIHNLGPTLLMGLCLSGLVSGAEARTDQEFNFRVLLDEREIGFHRFRVNQGDNREIVDIQANFKVTFLAIPLYRYGHSNREVWRNGCLQSIQSETDDNGDSYSVTGERQAAGFSLTTLDSRFDLSQNCVMTFAYWNMDMLEQDRLLNAQNGEYLPVSIEFEGSETLQLEDAAVNAVRYRLSNPENDIDITVWYDQATRRWLSLESRTKDDRKIRYWPTTAEAVLQSAFNADPAVKGSRESQR